MNRSDPGWRLRTRSARAWLALAWRVAVEVARRIAATVEEMNYAQRRLNQLRFSPDRYWLNPDVPPENYTEFLFRTSGPLIHEPAADRRGERRP